MDDDKAAPDQCDDERDQARAVLPPDLIPRPVAALTLDADVELTTDPAPRLSRFAWLAVIVAFVVTLAVPLLARAAIQDDPPNIRILQTDGRISALIADGELRVLVLNSSDPRTASATLGEARPWEPRPQIIIVPSDDAAATGLLAVVRASRPRAVLVAGLPGANPIWHALDLECRERGIDLEYTAGSMRIEGTTLTLTVFGVPLGTDEGRAVIVRRNDGDATVALALDRGQPVVAAHALVTSGAAPSANADLVITTDGEPRRMTHPELVLGYRDRARITLQRDRIDVFGGTYRGGIAADGAD